MKKLIIVVFIISIIFLVSCVNLDDYVEVEDYNHLQKSFNETIDDYSKLKEDNNNLKNEIYDLERRINLTKEENIKYNNLICNLNEYLSYVYPMKVSNDNYFSDGMGFTIEYGDKFYLITAGHGVHYVFEDYDVLYTNFKVKIDNKWIYLKLLDYKNDYMNKSDYAILTSIKIDSGFDVDLDNDRPLFLIGGNRLISDYSSKTVEGESGLPIIDIDGEVTEIATTDSYYYNTDIDIVLQTIDDLN